MPITLCYQPHWHAHLGGICMKEALVLSAQGPDLVDGLHHSNLIVDIHHRHQRSGRADGCLELLRKEKGNKMI
jgi:hypothetical protein